MTLIPIRLYAPLKPSLAIIRLKLCPSLVTDVTLFMWDRKRMVHIILDHLVAIDIQLHGLQTGRKPCALL